MNWIIIFTLLISLFNSTVLLLLYFFVNRNWEKLIELGNQIRTIDWRVK